MCENNGNLNKKIDDKINMYIKELNSSGKFNNANKLDVLNILSYRLIQYIYPCNYHNFDVMNIKKCDYEDLTDNKTDEEIYFDFYYDNEADQDYLIQFFAIDVKKYITMLDNSLGLNLMYKQFCDIIPKNRYKTYLDKWDIFKDEVPPRNYYENYHDSNPLHPHTYTGMMERLKTIKEYNEDFYYKINFIYGLAKQNTDAKQKFSKLNSKCNINSKSIEKTIEKFDKEKDSLTTQVKNEAKIEIDKIKSNIYADFIAILGIFTAITFAIFGGIQSIGSITSNLDISSNKPQGLGNLLICASILGILLYGIITVLFAGIDKLTNKTCSLPFTLNILVIGTLFALFLTGCIYSFFTKNVWSINITPRFILSLLVIITIVIICRIFYKLKKLKN